MQPSIAIGGAVGQLCRYSKGANQPSTLKDMLVESSGWELDESPGLPGSPYKTYERTVGLVFAGDGVEAASVILPPNIKNAKRVTLQLQRIKECVRLGDLNNPTTNSCAFMFACCGRGKFFHNNTGNVESKCFKALYPYTPLIGMFGEGEFGWNYLSNEKAKQNINPSRMNFEMRRMLEFSKEFRNVRNLKEEDICHSYTTVFVVLSFKCSKAKEDAIGAANNNFNN